MTHSPTHPPPAPSEQHLFAVWDLIDKTRARRGESVAQQVAAAALEAAERAAEQQPDQRTPRKDQP